MDTRSVGENVRRLCESGRLPQAHVLLDGDSDSEGIFDSHYDAYKGVICYVRVEQGTLRAAVAGSPASE